MKAFSSNDLEKAQENKNIKWREVKWKTLAERYLLIYYPELNPGTFMKLFEIIGEPQNLKYPDMDYIPTKIINQIIKPDKIFYGDNELLVVKGQMEIFQINVNEISTSINRSVTAIASLFPLKYIFHCPDDGMKTIFGGTAALGNFLQENAELEILPCYEDTVVSWPGADKLNGLTGSLH